MDATTAPPPPAADVSNDDAPTPVSPSGRPDLAQQVDPSALVVALLAITIPLAMTVAVWSTPTGALDWSRRVQLAPFDLVLVAAVAWAILHRSEVADLFRSTAIRWVSLLFTAWFSVSLAVNPSWLGVALGMRLGAGLCVIACTAAAVRRPASRSLALGAIAASGVAQTVLGAIQAQRGSVSGAVLIDWQVDLYQFGSSSAAQGGFPHPYHLTSFLLMAQAAAVLGLRSTRGSRLPWMAALGIMALGLAITYSRAAALGEIALLGCALLARADRRLLMKAAGVVLAGFLIGAVGFGSGWVDRSQATAGQQDGASIDSDRRTRLAEAGELIRLDPVFGVGPGQYVEALHAEARAVYQPAHNLVAHEAAEFGIPGGGLMVALLALLGFRVLRGGAWTGAVVLPMIPMLLLGSTGYVLATSFATSALWLGLAKASLDPPLDVTP